MFLKTRILVAVLLITAPLSALAALSYTTHNGDTIASVASKLGQTPAQFATAHPNATLRSNQTFTTASVPPVVVPPVVVPPVVVPPIVVPPVAGEVRFTAYITGYSYWDNTPPGSADISHGVIHSHAGGVGTYSDPTTIAVGHSIIAGQDILDYPAGTIFYLPNLRRYFIVEDTCGDGNSPQNGPCHTGYQGSPWLDVYVGGGNVTRSISDNCMNAITEKHLIIKNPASTYAVVSGEIASSCQQYGETVVQ